MFNDYTSQRTTELSQFYLSGIVSTDAAINARAMAADGGSTVNMPFWEDLTGNDEVLSDNAALSVSKIEAGQDKAVLNMRGNAWSVNELSKSLSGSDPMREIGDKVSAYWARKYQEVLMASMSGVFAQNAHADNSDMIVGDGTSAFDTDLLIDAEASFGDVLGAVSGIAVHPDVYYNLKRVDTTTFEKFSEGELQIETYRGMRIIVDRNLPKVANQAGDGFDYKSYAFGQGAFSLGMGSPETPSEMDRDSLSGDDILISRTHFILHPRGIKWTGTDVAGAAPTNDELDDRANWERVYARDQIRLCELRSNG
ncbi:MAG: major capsid protein [Flavobacteriaceae bacterium]|nr:major capsid protein [Flavobacteriaceae bacterium]